MAGKSEIEAGKAYISLLLKDASFSKGLTAAGNKLKSFGRGMSIIGGAIAGAGAAITAPLLAMAKEFADTGSALYDMSARTGATVESLSELKFAAEQSGASLEDVERALKFMAKNGERVAGFDQLAAKISAIEDPTKRAAKALKHWGKGGTALLPMIADLAALRQEARDAGLVMSGDAAKRADMLGDAFDKLRAIIKSVRLVIGDALSDTVRGAITSITNIAITVGKWVKANKELFVSALKIGVVLIGVGTALATMGGVVAAAGFALIGISGVLGLMAGLLSALVSPIGLVVGAVAGLAAWFATSTEWGRQMVTSLADWFGELRDIAVGAFGGISDAISAGNLALAGKIAMAGLKSAWLTGIEPLRETWIRFFNWLTQTMTLTALEIARQATQIWNAITHGPEAWNATIGNLMASIGEAAGHAWSRSANAEVAAAQDAAHERAKEYLSDEAVQQMKLIDDAGKKINEYYDAAERNVPTGDSESKKAIAAAREEMAAAQEQLRVLNIQAAQEKKAHDLAGGPKFKPGDVPTGDMIKSQVFGTFSAAAAAGGSDSNNPMVKEQREAKKILMQQLKEAQLTRAFMKQWGLA